jgi:nucleoside 2-deoxyribosyltransferase
MRANRARFEWLSMNRELKLTAYFAGALFSGQELFGNRVLALEIERASGGMIQVDLPQDLSAQEAGDGRGTRAADYLGMIRRDFVIANMNGPELDSGTVAEYMVASMIGMPRVQFRSDFRNVGDVRTHFPAAITVCPTAAVPYNLMLGHDASAMVFVNSMELYKSTDSLQRFIEKIAAATVQGIQLAFRADTASPEEYASHEVALVRNLRLDAGSVRTILHEKRERHQGGEYRDAVKRLVRS